MAPDVERSVKSAPKAKVFYFIDHFLIVHTLLLLSFFCLVRMNALNEIQLTYSHSIEMHQTE